MSLKLFNTLTRSVEPFPEDDRDIRMYICGVSPYLPAHVGHARCYVFFDVIKRYLNHMGRNTYHVQNITDVADEIHKQAKKEGIPDEELVNGYVSRYDEVFRKLNVSRADRYPRTSENITKIIEEIEHILERGKGYEVDGSIYFEARESDFGDLLGTSLQDIILEEGAPCSKKRSEFDMEVWERMEDISGSYESKWGRGRPGWNLQCYTMSKEFFEHPVDIHGGGTDLIFPHHEGERLITNILNGCEFAKFYLHVNFIRLEDKKMSKSAGNIVTLEEAFENWEPEVIRFYLLSKHYRESMDYDEDAIAICKEKMERIRRIERSLDEIKKTGGSGPKGLLERFKDALEDDMHTERALDVMEEACDILEEIQNGNERELDVHEVKEVFDLFHEVLGIQSAT